MNWIKNRSVIKNMLIWMTLALQTSCANVQNPINSQPDAPVAINFASSTQKHIQASSHWATIADDLAKQIKTNIDQHKIANRPVFVNLYSEPTEFTRAFNDFLITSLVNKGVTVSKLSVGSTVYNYKIQTVEYNSLRSTQLPSQAKWTALASGLVVIRSLESLDHVIRDGDGTILGAGVMADIFQNDLAPNLEIIITSSILSGSVYVARSSDIYYANMRDAALYQPKDKIKKTNVFDEPFYQQH